VRINTSLVRSLLYTTGFCLVAAYPAPAGAQNRWAILERANVSSSGEQDNSGAFGTFSNEIAISPDGRFVAFPSFGDRLVPGDTNGASDVFVRDRQTGQTTRVSVSSDGAQANSRSVSASISADGRFVAFESEATNLVPGDTNGLADAFVHDRLTGETRRISVASDGTQQGPNHVIQMPRISANGRFVAFESEAANLVAGDTNNSSDVFVHDLLTGRTTRISLTPGNDQFFADAGSQSISADGQFVAFNVSAGAEAASVYVWDRRAGQTTLLSVGFDGSPANNPSRFPSISADGRFVAFESTATNLVRGDTNGLNDSFVHDRATGRTERVSVSSNGSQANGITLFRTVLSPDGRFVAFYSLASNLVGHFLRLRRGGTICVSDCDTNNAADMFVHDRITGETTLISDTLDGGPPDVQGAVAISRNGRYIAFDARGANLLSGDTNGVNDIFIAGPRRLGPPPPPPPITPIPPTATKRVVNPPQDGLAGIFRLIDYRIEVTSGFPAALPMVVVDTPINGTVTVLGTSTAFTGCTAALLTTTGCVAPTMGTGTEFIAVRLTVSASCIPAGNSARVTAAGTALTVANPPDFPPDMNLAECAQIPREILVVDRLNGFSGSGALFAVAPNGTRRVFATTGVYGWGVAATATGTVYETASYAGIPCAVWGGLHGCGALIKVSGAQITTLSDFGFSGHGPTGWSVAGLAIEPSGSILVLDPLYKQGFPERGALFRVDQNSGIRTVLSDFTNPSQGPIGRAPTGVTVDGDGTILVADVAGGTDCHADSDGTNGCGALVRVDPTTGNRVVISDFGNPAQGQVGGGPTSVVRDLDGSYLVVDRDLCTTGAEPCGGLFSVDHNGNRRVITDFHDTSQGINGAQPTAVIVNADGTILINGCIFPDLNGICSVDRTTGFRQLYSDLRNPAEGPVGFVPLGMAVLP
jgi:Tol biopolymer transport system component